MCINSIYMPWLYKNCLQNYHRSPKKPKTYHCPLTKSAKKELKKYSVQHSLLIQAALVIRFCASSRSKNCLFQITNPSISALNWSFYSRIRNSRSNISRTYLPRITRETCTIHFCAFFLKKGSKKQYRTTTSQTKETDIE